MILNIIANWSNIFFTIVSVFVLYPFSVKTLGESQYGVWLLVVSATGYFSLLQLGVPLANVRFVSKYHAEKDYEKLNQVISTNISFFLTVSGLVFLSGLVLSFCLDWFFAIPANLNRQAFWSVILATANISLGLVFEIFEGVLHAFEQFMVINFVKNIALLIRVLLTYLVLRADDGLIALPLLLIMVTVLQGVTFCTFIKLKYSYVKVRPRYASASVFKQIAGYSIFVLLLQLASRLSFQTDAVVIGRVISTSAIVAFTVGNNLLLYLMEFVLGISKVIMPRISRISASCDSRTLLEIYRVQSQLLFLVMLPICIFFLILGGDFIALWMGEGFRNPSGQVLSILTLSYMFFLVQRGIAFPILMGTSNLKFPTYAMFAAAIFNLLLSLWWAGQYGIAGVAWGTTVPNLVIVLALIWYMKRTFGLNVLDYCYTSILLPLLFSLFFTIPCLLLKMILNVTSYQGLFLCGFISTAIYFIFLAVKMQWTSQVLSYLKRRQVRA